MEGETIAGERFDGRSETAIFPGDLPENGLGPENSEDPQAFPQLRFVRFRPPELERTAEGFPLSLPHIRLDRALEFLLGDRLA
jgi:predicted YcjX-like family ATPase